MPHPPVIFLMGPTASGKSDLAIKLSACLPCDIISVDSAMVYRGMDIGTAKPDKELRARITHRLIDIRKPSEGYSAAQFVVDALREMAATHVRGRIPLLVGGTMLYFRALQHGLSTLPGSSPELRARLEDEARHAGWGALHARLALIDPEAARRIHRNDPQRIQRALEVHELAGKSTTELYAEQTAETLQASVIKLIVAPGDRAQLHANIARRLHEMLKLGLVDEVIGLRDSGEINAATVALRMVGYRQVWSYLTGNCNCDEMTNSAIIATRQLAKRQFTWLRSETDAVWFDSLDKDIFRLVLSYCSHVLSTHL